MRINDFKILILLLISFFLHIFSFLIFYYYQLGFIWFPPLVYLLSGCGYILIRGSLRDPTGILLVGSGLYVFLPTLDANIYDYLRWGFKVSDAYYISNLSASSLMLSTMVFLFLKPMIKLKSIFNVDYCFLEKVKQIGLCFSIFLAIILIMNNGLLFMQAENYLDGFESRSQSGMGVLLLALPMAMISTSIVFLKKNKLALNEILFTLLPFILLFMATAQRRYFIIPFLIFLVCKVKVSFKGAIYTLFSVFLIYYSFLYLGYMRINEINLTVQNIIDNIGDFNENLPELIAGETLLLYATMGAAKAGVIEPLPLFGDYILAPLMSLPNFIFGSLYIPMNTKFSEYVTPLIAAQGGGWGFAYPAEGYVVASEFGIFISSLVICFIFRFIWIFSFYKSESLKFMNILCVCSVFTALFFYRNSFSYTFKDLTYLILCIIFLFFIANFFSKKHDECK